ncbi:MAG TPA: hypothetical protein VER11_06720 [Polyangiaceae bacterium]|nr:hypothetical protein [Polyangiaceae bacterium]
MFKLHSFLAPAIAVTAVACGARFTAHENDGTVGGAAGEASGGFTSSAGSSSVGDAGEPEVGGNTSAGAAPVGGAGGAVTGTAGATSGGGGWTAGRGGWGNGGWGNGGWGPGSGGASSADCTTLGEQYQAAVEKARVCDKGSTDQCSASSAAEPVGGCGCPVLINTKSEAADAANKAYQAYQKAGCAHTGPICDVFCAPAMSASCEPSSTANNYVCTAGGLLK